MAKTYDDTKTKISVELEEFKGKKDPSKTYEGIRVRIGEVSRVLFVTPNEMTHVKAVLKANE